MKKRFFASVFFVVFSLLPVAAEPFNFNWDFGSVFFGGYSGFSDYNLNNFESEMELDVQVLNFRFETEDGFSFMFCPLNCWMNIRGNNKESDHLVSFFNCTFAYDLFEFQRAVQLMPYVALHAVALEGLHRFSVDCGIAFNTFPNSVDPDGSLSSCCSIDLNIFTVKAGVRLNQFNPQAYLDIGINLLIIAMLFLHTPEDN